MPYKCNCEHKEQDRIYGVGIRYHNFRKAKTLSATGLRCTVCGSEKEINAPKKKDDK